MKSILTKILSVFFVSVLGLGVIALPASAVKDVDICKSLSAGTAAWEANGCGNNSNSANFNNTIINIINWVLGIIALVAVIAVIVGGVQYMTSVGDPGKIKKAKDTILYALIGLAICGLAAIIVNFVIGAINSASSSNNTALHLESGKLIS